MPSVTILGSGVVGMAVASQLPPEYDVTIAARDLPGDSPPTGDWASPWACAGWAALGPGPGAADPARDEAMLLDSLARSLRLARDHPESGVRAAEMTDVVLPGGGGGGGGGDGGDGIEGMWFHGRLPGYRVVSSSSSGEGEEEGDAVVVKYTSFALDPAVYLPWQRRHLEQTPRAGSLRFARLPGVGVSSLADLARRHPADVIVNASGAGAAALSDVVADVVADDDDDDCPLTFDRTHVIVVRSSAFDSSSYVRRQPPQYTYVFGRGDGTAVVGGVSEPLDSEPRPDEEIRAELIQRAHASLPHAFPSPDPAAYDIVADLRGVRPLRAAGVRAARADPPSAAAIAAGHPAIVHAYGTSAGGYMYGLGLGAEVARLVREAVAEQEQAGALIAQ